MQPLVNACIIHKDPFAERVAGHMINDVNFCTSCGNGCNHCRLPLGSHAGSIQVYHEIEGELPEFIEEPAVYLPRSIPRCDVLIAIGLHPDILGILPRFAKDHGILALIVPVEDKKWLQFGMQKQLADECTDLGIQHAFPRPFCDLNVQPDDASRPTIREFMDAFKVGRPRVELDIKDGKILNGRVLRTQPCGCAYYILQQLRNETIYESTISLDEKISLAHHAFPCSASMDKDPILGDSPLHVAGYLARDSIHDAIEQQLGILDRARFHRPQAASSSD
ncbi:MAG: hypothetical protein GYA24_10150 [Candidatus Lokiarchaeota archaeon]|nr:hypothetical protein [Candidatus Lokiarchaeota archaeon]